MTDSRPAMNDERWRRVMRAYESLTDIPGPQRRAAVTHLCDGDDEMRRELEALLAQDERPSPLDRALWHTASNELQPVSRLPLGTQLGPYRIEGVLGAGGMGEVYRARDTKLERDVALKVLPHSVTHDVDRLRRFTREAHVLASLNHPNIAAIYGLEDTGGIQALVLELVDGQTIAERMRSGRLPMAEAIAIAVQIAEAFEAAHERGVVHRDLKPSNVMVTRDGAVKVLDFGLAKSVATIGRDGEAAAPHPQETIGADLTDRHSVIGTPAYMAPEQATGRMADRRTDVWSFGCLLYEMLSGRRVFAGDDVPSVLRAVMRGEVDWSALPPSLSPSLTRLLKRCLEVDRRRRLADFTSLRLELIELGNGGTVPETQVPQRRGHRLAWTLAAACAAMIAVAFAGLLWRAEVSAPPRASFYINPPEGWRFTLAGPQAQGGGLALSPDGRRIAFLATNTAGETAVWVRTLELLTAERLPGTEGAGEGAPFWSDDGRFLAFFADGKLKRVALAGGPPEDVCDTPSFRGGTWNRDGTIVFAPGSRSALFKVPATGGTPTAVTTLQPDEPGHMSPQFLPDGRHFLFYIANFRGIHVASVDAPGRAVVIEHPDAATVAYTNGHLLFLRGTTLLAQRFDTSRFSLTGEAVAVADDVFSGNPPIGVFAASPNGVLVFAAGAAARSQLAWFDRSGRQLETIGDAAEYQDAALSPDETRIAVTLADDSRRGGTDIWIVDARRGFRTRLTTDTRDDGSPVWSPNSRRIAFASRRKARLDIYEKLASGTDEEVVLLSDETDKLPTSWSPDGRHLLYVSPAGGLQRALWALPMMGTATSIRVSANPSTRRVHFSPDGRWIAYTEGEAGGRAAVYVAPFPQTGGRVRVFVDGGTQPRWRRDGGEIYYRRPDGMLMAATVRYSEDNVTIAATKELFRLDRAEEVGFYDVSQSGDRFLLPVPMTPQGPVLAVMTSWTTALRTDD